MSFRGVNIPIRTRVDTSELKAAIADFDGSTEAIKRLAVATKDVKNESKELFTGISTLSRAQRANSFELLEGIRVLRSFTGVARDLNQVWQSITLRNIEGTQQTVAQRQAYEDLTIQLSNVANALTIFGPNGEVQKGFGEIIDKADSLSSTDLQKLIDQSESLKSSLRLTPDQLASLDQFIQKLRDLKKETITDEEKKQWEDYFGLFTNSALAAGGIASFAAALTRHKEALSAILSLIAKSKPELAIIILLLFGEPAAKALGLLQYAGDSSVDTIKPGTINPKTGKPYDFTPGPDGRVPDQGDYTDIRINIERAYLNSLDPDTRTLATNLIDEIERRKAQKKP